MCTLKQHLLHFNNKGHGRLKLISVTHISVDENLHPAVVKNTLDTNVTSKLNTNQVGIRDSQLVAVRLTSEYSHESGQAHNVHTGLCQGLVHGLVKLCTVPVLLVIDNL